MSVVCKVMENIVVSSIMQYTGGNSINVLEQHGLRCGCSCETQLFGLAVELTQYLQ